MVKKLKFMPYGKCKVYSYYDNSVILQSYATPVVRIKNNWISCRGLFSATTRKHIGAFLKEYAPNISFKSLKEIVREYELNIETGEIRPYKEWY